MFDGAGGGGGGAGSAAACDQYTRESRSLSIYSTTGKYAGTGGGFGAAGHGGNGEGVDNGGSCANEPPNNKFTDDDFYNRDDDDDDDDDEDDDTVGEGSASGAAANNNNNNNSGKANPAAACEAAAAAAAKGHGLFKAANAKLLVGVDETQASLLDNDSVSIINSKGKKVSHLSVWSVIKFIRPDVLCSLVGVLASLLMGLCIPISAMIIGDIATIFATDKPDEIRRGLFSHGLMYTVLALFAFVVSFIQVLAFGLAGEQIGIELRLRGFQAIMDHDLAWFDMKRNNPGSVCARLASDVGNVQSITGNRTAVIFQSVSILVSTFVFAIYFNFKFSSICALFVAILLVSTVMQARFAGKLAQANRAFDSQIGKIVLESSANIKTLASLHQEGYFIERCEQLLQRDKRSTSIDNHLRLSLESLKYAMTAISKGSAFYFAAGMLLRNEISIDVIFKLIEIILYGLTEASKSLIFISDLEKARRGTQNLYRLIHNNHNNSSSSNGQLQVAPGDFSGGGPPDLKGAGGQRGPRHLAGRSADSANRFSRHLTKSASLAPTQLSRSNPNYREPNPDSGPHEARAQIGAGHLKFDSVRFHYPSRPEACVLKSLSVDIPAGKSVALVGRSGCGKSTIVQLMEKFYLHSQGSIQLDGLDLKRLPTEWVRKQIALVSQEPSLLSYSIGDNIRYGDTSREVSLEEVRAAARVANIHDFIMSLPNGYETHLSESNSLQLSGGQKQRIAIARALVRRAPILVFDEATSALDTKSEQLVQEALDRARAGKTCIIIAHRLSAIRGADCIVVLRDGQVVEQGSHGELLERRGEYYTLYKTQSRM